MIALRTEVPAKTKQERLFYLDWLRVLAVLGVFFFHTLLPFDAFGDWYVKNRDPSLVASLIVGWVNEVGMPLLFVLAGAASCFALRSRTGRQFLHERSMCLLIPLAMGFLLLSPPQTYMDALIHGRFAGNFFQFVPWFFIHIQPSWHIAWIGTYAYHLWFLAFLWLYSLVALPLFVFLRGAAGSRVIDKLAAWGSRPGGIFLFALPIAIIQMALRATFPYYADWADFTFWFAFFVYGYALFSQPSLTEVIHRYGWIALGIGIICAIIMTVATLVGPGLSWVASPNYTLGSLLYQLLRSINTWAWLIVILSSGISYLNRNSSVLSYANEAVLPFYVLHHPVIIVIAFYVVQWEMGILPKWLMIMTLSLALLLMVRLHAEQPAHGMKPHHQAPRGNAKGTGTHGHEEYIEQGGDR